MYKELKKMIVYAPNGILSKELIKTETLNLTLFCMAKGTEISEHTSTKEGTVYVIEGKGLFYLAGKKVIMIPGTLILMKKNQKHSLKAEENTAFILSLINSIEGKK